MRSRSGFTLIELLVTFIMLTVMVTLFFIIPSANCWFTEAGVLKRLQLDDPTATEVVVISRNIGDYSELKIKHKDGKTSDVALDTNILFNYKFIKP